MFMSGGISSDSHFNYSFAQTSSGSWTVTLNHVTANIVRSDLLLNNGVIHIIDAVLYNVDPNFVPKNTTSTPYVWLILTNCSKS